MRIYVFPAILLFAAAALGQAQQKQKSYYIDPAEAGHDWKVQGEYIGGTGKTKVGAEVIARGKGLFDINLLPGGLRGQGGDYARRLTGTAKQNETNVAAKGKGGKWSGVISNGEFVIETAGGKSVTLKKTIRKSKTLGLKPTKGAVVLYGGPKDIANWPRGHTIGANLLAGDIDSKQSFKDHKIHLEFRLSFMPTRRGQARSNSGVYVQHRYEVQVLDSFGLKGRNNECGGVYSQKDPNVNMCYPPLTWQTYDIDFKAPRFDSAGKKIKNAVLTVRHNGVLIHDKLELKGPTPGGRQESPAGGPLFIQGHGGHVQYRNIWVVESSEN